MAKISNVVFENIQYLKKYENNAKKHGEKQIEKIAMSIEEFGFISPCIIDRDKNVIAGHGRIQAAERLGLGSVPCVLVEGLSEEQRKAYILADNRLTELGAWDMELVNFELSELGAYGFDVDLTGFELNDISEDDFGDEFTLKDGDREPVQNMTFTFSDDEAEIIKTAIAEMKTTQKFKDYDNPLNKNGNGNALFLVVDEWRQQRT